MSEPKREAEQVVDELEAEETVAREQSDWETPTMEDVSEQVMAQPYIRFT